MIAVNQLSDLETGPLAAGALAADGQNANVYDGEWNDIIAYKLSSCAIVAPDAATLRIRARQKTDKDRHPAGG